jgi:phosphomannomutase
MQDCIIALDPDRDRVVAVYGEATTRAIERASML